MRFSDDIHTLYNKRFQVLSNDECNKSISIEENEKNRVPEKIRLEKLPDGIRKELACIHAAEKTSCQVKCN
jgi:hypothetical protein